VDGLPAHLPDTPAFPKAIATGQFRQFEIRFLKQERGTRGGASAADEAALEQDR
jgi:hypothetical protein